MIRRILALAAVELRIAARNRWIAIATLLMSLFALALTFAGSAPTGKLGVDLLTVAVASMTTLIVYLAPLIALLLSFDAIAGEVDRGGLSLLLTYPVGRGELLLGKFVAHLAVLAVAVTVGLGLAGGLAAAAGGAGPESLAALLRLGWSAILLGASFLALGYAASGLARSPGAAAGIAIGIWLVFVVLYDLGLLGAVVYDAGGGFTTTWFPAFLLANPADAFRLWNISAAESANLVSGLGAAASSVPRTAALGSLLLWPLLSLGLARLVLGRLEP